MQSVEFILFCARVDVITGETSTANNRAWEVLARASFHVGTPVALEAQKLVRPNSVDRLFMELEPAIPSFDACKYDWPPIPATIICWHPEADDCFNVSGIGKTRLDAYLDMLAALDERLSPKMSDEHYAVFEQRLACARHEARVTAQAKLQGVA